LYRDHVPQIAANMRASEKTFKRAVVFVLCTIRQKLTNIPAQMEAIDRGDYTPLWGFKMAGYDYLETHAQELHAQCLAATTAQDAIGVLCRVPGLGIVKAAFVAQLMGWDVACLDSRNVRRMGLAPRAWRTDGKAVKPERIAAYVKATGGKARALWDTWCKEVADAYKSTPEAISALHVECILQHDLDDTF
jgi:hypothetical protein